MTPVVFSKDRALQLHAFVRSYEAHVAPSAPLHVLFRASTPRHEAAYHQVRSASVIWHPQTTSTSFKNHLLSILPTIGRVVFFVDDQIVIRPWTGSDLPGTSLRLGVHLTRNYASGDTPQPLPPFVTSGPDRLTWVWARGQLAWGYPLSLDGHVFDLAEFRPLIEACVFDAPNALEAALQQFAPQFRGRLGSCYRDAKVVNVPWNRVQTAAPNRCAADETTSADAMLGYWEAGQQIAVEDLYGMVNASVHQVVPLRLEARA